MGDIGTPATPTTHTPQCVHPIYTYSHSQNSTKQKDLITLKILQNKKGVCYSLYYIKGKTYTKQAQRCINARKYRVATPTKISFKMSLHRHDKMRIKYAL